MLQSEDEAVESWPWSVCRGLPRLPLSTTLAVPIRGVGVALPDERR